MHVTKKTQAKAKRWPEAIAKSDIVYPSSGMSQSCQLTVVISAITSYHQRNCDQRYKSNELGQHPKEANGILHVEVIIYMRYLDKLCRFPMRFNIS